MSSSSVVVVDGLSKHFRVPTREAGLIAASKSLFKRTYRLVQAVDKISFSIDPGEVVGFLGPNGAGKTTTLKMLSGLLFPTGGSARVLGFDPSRRQAEFLQQVTLLMGNRSQLNWDLPAMDSFDLLRAVYDLPRSEFKHTRDEFIELLELQELVRKPVRNLSLGERMKVETVGALLHRPKVLFLDEPTLGLDVTMQHRIRDFIAEYNRRTGATILLTSHYMADVEALCRRVIVIHNGHLLFDGELAGLVDRFSAFKTICATVSGSSPAWSQYGEVVDHDRARVTLRVPKAKASEVTARILAEQPVEDLTVEDPPIEDVIEKVFSEPGKARE
jgi:ABC-2 type transport system ATP-binding protein